MSPSLPTSLLPCRVVQVKGQTIERNRTAHRKRAYLLQITEPTARTGVCTKRGQTCRHFLPTNCICPIANGRASASLSGESYFRDWPVGRHRVSCLLCKLTRRSRMAIQLLVQLRAQAPNHRASTTLSSTRSDVPRPVSSCN